MPKLGQNFSSAYVVTRYPLGMAIERVCADAQGLADYYECEVEFNFNGVVLRARPQETTAAVLKRAYEVLFGNHRV